MKCTSFSVYPDLLLTQLKFFVILVVSEPSFSFSFLPSLHAQPDTRWLHRGVKSLSQAEQILRKEHRDGAFFVYRTQSDYAPYIVAYR